MGKHFDKDFKEMVVNDYKSGNSGGRKQIAKKYSIDESTIWHWIVKDRNQGNQINDINKKRGRTKEENEVKCETIMVYRDCSTDKLYIEKDKIERYNKENEKDYTYLQ